MANMMTKLERAKQVILENIDDARYGIFNTRNLVGDAMENIYSCDGLDIDICYPWMYFEVFGLSGEEFHELKRYYKSLLQKDGDPE